MKKKKDKSFTVDKKNVKEPIYFGIKKEAIGHFERLSDKMEEVRYWNCKNNSYYYQDYDGLGFEDENGNGNARPLTEDECEELCADCPLLKLCYDFAVANGEEHGIWGGINFTKSIDNK